MNTNKYASELPGVLEKAAQALRRASRLRPTLAIALGSGWSAVADQVRRAARLPYSQIPGFSSPRVAGHEGGAVIGRLGGVPVLLLCGRTHYYEGHTMHSITFPVRALAAFGIRDLLLTNAAGLVNTRFLPGDFMMLTDHLNFMGDNPLRGWPSPSGDGFVDMSRAYDRPLQGKLKAAATKAGVRLRQGVYAALPGPSYETPAEIRALRKLGADAVGMSTVPEVIVARHCGLRVAALSCLTNWAAGIRRETIAHQEVMLMGQRVAPAAGNLIAEFVRQFTIPP